jgi:FtsH-binding integral membrane protein
MEMKESYPLLNENAEEIQKLEDAKIDNMIRKGFIAKVYSLLFIQLFLTFTFVFLSMEIKSLKLFIIYHYWIYVINIIIPFIVLIIFLVDPKKTKQVPINYILLFAFCFSEGYAVARIVINFQKQSVYFALLLTLITVLALSLYAYKTKEDFTLYGGSLFISLILLIIGSIINIFFRIKLLTFIITVLVIILFSIYIIYDTQLILGNKQFKLSEDDYIIAVLNLYIDIINLFIELLSIFGKSN